MNEHKLELVIVDDSEGNKVNLENLSLKAANSLMIMLDSLTKIIQESLPDDNVRIKITKGSVVVSAEATPGQIETLENDFQDIVSNNSRKREIIEPWRNIQSLIHANGLHYEINFRKGEDVFPVINKIPTKKITVKPDRTSKDVGIVFLKGKLIALGGKKPNIHITSGEEKIPPIQCEESDAIKVNGLIYQEIALSAWASYKSGKIQALNFCDYYPNIEHYTEFKQFFDEKFKGNEVDMLIALHYKLKSFLDEKDFGRLKKFLRLFNHESTSAGTIKTILVITKAFRDHEKFSDQRILFTSLLENKIGRPLI